MTEKDDIELRVTSFFGLYRHEEMDTKIIIPEGRMTMEEFVEKSRSRKNLAIVSQKVWDELMERFK